MAIENESFRKIFTLSTFSKTIAAIVIDECHLIPAWGDKFRMAYGKLKTLRAYVGPDTPFLAVSATLTKTSRANVATALQMERSKTFFLNRGNDRPNVKWVVEPMQHGVGQFADLNFVIGHTNRHEDKTLKKTIIFCNEIRTTHNITNHLRSLVPEDQHDAIQPYHSQRSQLSKGIVMDQFVKGDIRVLVATEAAGMVCLI